MNEHVFSLPDYVSMYFSCMYMYVCMYVCSYVSVFMSQLSLYHLCYMYVTIICLSFIFFIDNLLSISIIWCLSSIYYLYYLPSVCIIYLFACLSYCSAACFIGLMLSQRVKITEIWPDDTIYNYSVITMNHPCFEKGIYCFLYSSI
jgi:hypothetical protein